MVRPSYVLGGRGMEVVHDEEMLKRYVAAAVGVTPERSILIDKFLENAIECEADAISDGADAFVPAVMEHIEFAGIHSGDSACVIPPISIPARHIDTICYYTRKIAVAFSKRSGEILQAAIEIMGLDRKWEVDLVPAKAWEEGWEWVIALAPGIK